ncbi:hypothetical protein KC362_g90 [Hortaea werneckii]|nr:hypothetical protein KC362_g90 [Hortaea werneckii]
MFLVRRFTSHRNNDAPVSAMTASSSRKRGALPEKPISIGLPYMCASPPRLSPFPFGSWAVISIHISLLQLVRIKNPLLLQERYGCEFIVKCADPFGTPWDVRIWRETSPCAFARRPNDLRYNPGDSECLRSIYKSEITFAEKLYKRADMATADFAMSSAQGTSSPTSSLSERRRRPHRPLRTQSTIDQSKDSYPSRPMRTHSRHKSSLAPLSSSLLSKATDLPMAIRRLRLSPL